MGGNEGEIDAVIFLFLWERRGDRGGDARPSGGGAVHAWCRCGRRKKACGGLGRSGGGVRWAGPAGRTWPSGGGEENRPVKEKEDWAERPGGPKVTGRILFRIKIDF
jgi:hypothetical protein